MSSVTSAWNLTGGWVDTEPNHFFHNNTLCGYTAHVLLLFKHEWRESLWYIYFPTQENAIKVVCRTCKVITSFFLMAWALITCLVRENIVAPARKFILISFRKHVLISARHNSRVLWLSYFSLQILKNIC